MEQNFSSLPSPEGLSGTISPQGDFIMTSPLNSNEGQHGRALLSPILSPSNQNPDARPGGILSGLINQTANNDKGKVSHNFIVN